MFIVDIMTKEVITAHEGDPITDVAVLMSKYRIHGVPVVDKDNKVLGIITETDFFTKDASSIHLPSFIDFIKDGHLDADNKKTALIDSALHATAKDIMSTPCFTVNDNLNINELIKLFKEQSLTCVPVVDDKNILVGIITVADVIKLL
jgi:CBS domain-containing protein